jgi:uncharacterized protein YjbJ (UPF0337 family)
MLKFVATKRFFLDIQPNKDDTVKSSSKNKIEGKMHQVKGTIKETVGKVLNNKEMAAEGKLEKMKGKVDAKIGQFKKMIKK